MATGVWCELVCEDCARTAAGMWVLSYSIPRGRMKAHAKAHGWTDTRDRRGMLCRACTGKRTARAPEERP